MIEDVTLTWATGELLVSPVGLADDARERLARAGFVGDRTLDLLVAGWSPAREDLALAIHQLPDVSHDSSPFAFLAGRRAEGLRRRLRQLEAATACPTDLLAESGWYLRGEPHRLWRLQLDLVQLVRLHERPCAAAARRTAIEKALAALPDTCDLGIHRRRAFLRGRLRFERGEMTDPLPW